jgi:hypothetical protein
MMPSRKISVHPTVRVATAYVVGAKVTTARALYAGSR